MSAVVETRKSGAMTGNRMIAGWAWVRPLAAAVVIALGVWSADASAQRVVRAGPELLQGVAANLPAGTSLSSATPDQILAAAAAAGRAAPFEAPRITSVVLGISAPSQWGAVRDALIGAVQDRVRAGQVGTATGQRLVEDVQRARPEIVEITETPRNRAEQFIVNYP